MIFNLKVLFDLSWIWTFYRFSYHFQAITHPVTDIIFATLKRQNNISAKSENLECKG